MFQRACGGSHRSRAEVTDRKLGGEEKKRDWRLIPKRVLLVLNRLCYDEHGMLLEAGSGAK